MRLIDADALIMDLRYELEHDCDRYSYWTDKLERDAKYEFAIDRIESAPTIEARPVVRGEWVKLDAHKGIEQFKCSICQSECYVPTCMGEPMYGYCPNCGADMRGEDDGA